MRPLTQIHVADIHFGAINPADQYKILMKQLVYKIENLQYDFFFINGDLFHHKFMSNSDVVMYASMFIESVVCQCRRKGATLIILHGTASHDANQTKLFYHYMGSLDICIVENTQFVMAKGIKILCIPEEYGKGEDYYREFLYNQGSYDMVVLHGTLAESIYGKDVEDLNSTREPVFSINSFKMCSGPVICGHVHVPMCYDDHMYYCGSPIRWQFGEEDPKGFLICVMNPYTNQYYIQLEEINSYSYTTITLTDILTKNANDIIKFINNEKESKGIDYIRIKFKEPYNEIDVIKQYYKYRFDVVIDSADVRFQNIVEQNQQANDEFKNYQYILDENLTPLEILVRYINQQKQDTFITVDELTKILET